MSRWVILILTITACSNPTASIRDKTAQFKSEYADHFQTLKTAHGSIRLAWSGDAGKRPVLFVHGSPGSLEGWSEFLLNSELQKDFQLIAVDRPGYGGSDHGRAQTSLAIQASEVLEALSVNHSGLGAILVGHSYGGPVIAKAAMDHGPKVAGLVIVAGALSPEFEKIKWYQYVATWWPLRDFIPTDLRVCNEEIFQLKSELIALLPAWKSVSAKIVTIQGEDDDQVPKGNQDFLLESVNPKTVTKIVRVPGLNHFVPWKRPDLIVDGIQTLARAASLWL